MQADDGNAPAPPAPSKATCIIYMCPSLADDCMNRYAAMVHGGNTIATECSPGTAVVSIAMDASGFRYYPFEPNAGKKFIPFLSVSDVAKTMTLRDPVNLRSALTGLCTYVSEVLPKDKGASNDGVILSAVMFFNNGVFDAMPQKEDVFKANPIKIFHSKARAETARLLRCIGNVLLVVVPGRDVIANAQSLRKTQDSMRIMEWISPLFKPGSVQVVSANLFDAPVVLKRFMDTVNQKAAPPSAGEGGAAPGPSSVLDRMAPSEDEELKAIGRLRDLVATVQDMELEQTSALKSQDGHLALLASRLCRPFGGDVRALSDLGIQEKKEDDDDKKDEEEEAGAGYVVEGGTLQLSDDDDDGVSCLDDPKDDDGAAGRKRPAEGSPEGEAPVRARPNIAYTLDSQQCEIPSRKSRY